MVCGLMSRVGMRPLPSPSVPRLPSCEMSAQLVSSVPVLSDPRLMRNSRLERVCLSSIGGVYRCFREK